MRLVAALAIACTAPLAYADEPPAGSGSAARAAGSDAGSGAAAGSAAPEAGSGAGSAAAAPDAAATEAGSDAGEPAPTIDDLQAQIDQLQRAQQGSERRIAAQSQILKDREWLNRFVTVYVDVGGFAVAGDGSGIRSDLGHLYFPTYAGRIAGQWVFMGDPRSTGINALGEPADTSDSRELTNDTLASRGHPTVLVNSIGLAVGKSLDNGISVSALAELLPRPHDDILDVEYAHVNYRPLPIDLVIEAGKIDSVLGVEYRSQDAPRRMTVTPSLIARYTTGRPYGIDARLSRGRLVVSAAVTDGNMMDHRFEREHSLHSTWLPSVAGHIQWKQGHVEVGVSGAAGPQDDQPRTDIAQWHLGVDFQVLDLQDWDVMAEYVQGSQQGEAMAVPCDVTACLTYKGAYLLVDHRVAPWITPYARLDWRDAVHTHGADFVYESHVARDRRSPPRDDAPDPREDRVHLEPRARRHPAVRGRCRDELARGGDRLMRLPLVLLLLAAPASAGTVTGTVVAVRGGKPIKPEYAFVYLQPVRPVHGKSPGAGLAFEIHQKDKQFVPHVLAVPTGSVVSFPNDDKETHNVFSPNGPPEQFDLGRKNPSERPSHTFDDPGEVELYCDIHKEMWAKVKVVDSPYIAPVVDGKYTIPNVAPGTYRVVAWAPSSNEVLAPEEVTVTATQTATVKELHLQVAPIRTTHARKDGKPYCPDGYADC